MAKIIDITEKLSFDENPKIKIAEEEYEINTDAEIMLLIMGAFKTKSPEEASLEAANLIFGEENNQKIIKSGIKFKDYMTVIEVAMQLIQGEDPGAEQ